ncbi:MAG: hypothetical protein ABIH42_03055, partial [Planctomycetota bacterium]
MNKRLIFLITILAALMFSTFALAQENEPAPQQKKQKFIYVPYEDIDKILGRNKYGVVVDFSEYLRILKEIKKKEESKPPVDWILKSSEYAGVAGEEQIKFTGELTFTILTDEYVTIPIPFGAVGITSAALDGNPANISPTSNNYSLIASGKGTHKLSLTFATPLKREKRGKSFGLNIPSCPCTNVTINIPGKTDVKLRPDIFSKTYSEEKNITTVNIFAGGQTMIVAYIAAEEKQTNLEPFVISAPRFLVSLNSKSIRVQSSISVKVSRKEISSLTIGIPEEYKILELFCKEMLDWSEEKDAEHKILLRFREPVKEQTTITLSIEKDIPDTMKVEVPKISVLEAQLSSPLIQIAPSEDISFEIVEKKNLNEKTPEAVSTDKNKIIPVKAFEGWSNDYKLAVDISKIEPVVDSFMTTLVSVERSTINMDVFCSFIVKEGTLYNFSISVPKEWGILNAATDQPQEQYEYTVVEAADEKKVNFLFKQKQKAGTVIQCAVYSQQFQKKIDWKSISFPVPRVVPLASKFRLGTIIFGTEEAMTLHGKNTVELSNLDISQIENRGIPIPNTVLGYEAKDTNYSGTITATMKKTKVSANTITYLAVNESLFQISSLISLMFSERPAREFQFILPAGTGSMIDIRGEFIKEKSLSTTPDGDCWKISLQKEVTGLYTLFVSFDQKFSKESIELTAPKIVIPNAQRQDGFIGVEAGEGIEIRIEPANLTELAINAMPYPEELVRYYRLRRLLINAYRYTNLDYSLKLKVSKYNLKQVITEVIPAASYTTVFSENGTERTNAIFRLNSTGNQFFTFTLPEDAELWSVLIGRHQSDLKPVKPAKLEASILVPLTAAPAAAEGDENNYLISVVYQRKSTHMANSGTIQLSLPKTKKEIPVLSSTWSTYLPAQYRYSTFGGDMKVVTKSIEQTLFLSNYWLIIFIIFAVILLIALLRMIRLTRQSKIFVYCIVIATVIIIALLVIPSSFKVAKRYAQLPQCEPAQGRLYEPDAYAEFDKCYSGVILNKPTIECEKMVESPSILFEDENEKTKDIPRGTSF